MNTWFLLIALILLGFVIIESLVIRGHRTRRYKIDFLYTLHRLLVQRQGFRIEDTIALSVFLFLIGLLWLLLGSRWHIEVGYQADAQVKLTPEIHQQQDETSRIEGEETLVHRYEEYVFDVKPAMVIDYALALEAEDFSNPVGRHDLDGKASGGSALVAEEGEHNLGELGVSDPTKLQEAGAYQVLFRLKFSDHLNPEVVAQIQVWDDHNQVKLAQRLLKGVDFAHDKEYQYFEMKYDRPRRGSVQVKVLYMGIGDLGFDKVEINPIRLENAVYDTALFYADVPDKEASQGLARKASEERDIPGRLAFGPYDESLSEGYYRAVYHLKTSDNQKDLTLALIDVASDNPDFKPVYKNISAQDFDQVDQYQNFSLDFYKPQGGYLEFRVYYYGVADLFFDRVDLYKITPSEGL